MLFAESACFLILIFEKSIIEERINASFYFSFVILPIGSFNYKT